MTSDRSSKWHLKMGDIYIASEQFVPKVNVLEAEKEEKKATVRISTTLTRAK